MHRIALVPAASDEHWRDARALSASRQPVPFVHSHASASSQSRSADLWCRVLNNNDQCVAGAVISVDRSRKLPWVRIGRIAQATMLLEHLDSSGISELCAQLRRTVPNMAGLTVQSYHPEPPHVAAQRALLSQSGFAELADARSYTHSLVLPLNGSEDELFSRLSASARRNVRQVAAHGYSVRRVTDTVYAHRLAALVQASHERTGGFSGLHGFESLIHAAQLDPETSIVLGIFHPVRTGVNALVGFAQGTLAPYAATYAVAGTERSDDIGRVPLSYALLWELLRWGRERRLPFFDFGGVTALGDLQNPLNGISEFKRKFGGADTEIAAEAYTIISPANDWLLSASARVVQRFRG